MSRLASWIFFTYQTPIYLLADIYLASYYVHIFLSLQVTFSNWKSGIRFKFNFIKSDDHVLSKKPNFVVNPNIFFSFLLIKYKEETLLMLIPIHNNQWLFSYFYEIIGPKYQLQHFFSWANWKLKYFAFLIHD